MVIEHRRPPATMAAGFFIADVDPVGHGIVDLFGEVAANQPLIHGIETALAVVAPGRPRFFRRRQVCPLDYLAIVAVPEVGDHLPEAAGTDLLLRSNVDCVAIDDTDRTGLLSPRVLVHHRKVVVGERWFFVVCCLRLCVQGGKDVGKRHVLVLYSVTLVAILSVILVTQVKEQGPKALIYFQ